MTVKKIIHTVCIALLTGTSAFAQAGDTSVAATVNSKEVSFKSINGHEVLPQQGECALGISATGFFNYVGNLFNNNTGNTAPSFSSANAANAFAIGQLSGVALMGKYMKTADMAYRVRFQVNAGSVDYRNNVLQSLPTPDPLNPKYVEDKLTISSYTVLIGAGFEKRRGAGRVQGFYGAEGLLGMAGNSRNYTYGNAFTSDYNTPMSTIDFNASNAGYVSSRMLYSKTGTMFLFGIRAFTGIEYFIAPKISLGGEIGYTLGFTTNGKGSTTTETWNAPTEQTATITKSNYAAGGLRSWGIGLDNVNAGINLHFYF